MFAHGTMYSFNVFKLIVTATCFWSSITKRNVYAHTIKPEEILIRNKEDTSTLRPIKSTSLTNQRERNWSVTKYNHTKDGFFVIFSGPRRPAEFLAGIFLSCQ